MRKNDIPKYNETFNPILDILRDGKILNNQELQKQVIDKYYSHLPKDLLEQTISSGELLITNRIGWGKSYLKKAGYIISPKRGDVQITEKGLNQKEQLTLREVQGQIYKLNDYTENISRKATKTVVGEIQNASPQDLIDEGFNQIELELKNEVLEKLKKIDP